MLELKSVGQHYSGVWFENAGVGFQNCKEISPRGTFSLQLVILVFIWENRPLGCVIHVCWNV